MLNVQCSILLWIIRVSRISFCKSYKHWRRSLAESGDNFFLETGGSKLGLGLAWERRSPMCMLLGFNSLPHSLFMKVHEAIARDIPHSYVVKILTDDYFVLWQYTHLTDGRTDRTATAILSVACITCKSHVKNDDDDDDDDDNVKNTGV